MLINTRLIVILSILSKIIVSIGIVGSLLNLVIYRSKKFRRNSCGIYLLFSTIFDLSYLLISGLTNSLQIDSLIYCKFRSYFVIICPSFSTIYLMCSTIDRCLSTSKSNRIRKLANSKTSWRICLFVLIFHLLSNVHILLFYDYKRDSSLTLNVYRCVPRSRIYQMLLSGLMFVLSPLIFYSVMLINTIIIRKRIRNQTNESTMLTTTTRQRKKSARNDQLNKQLMLIIVFQIVFGIVFTLFRCGFLISTFIRRELGQSMFNSDLDQCFDHLTLFMYYLNFSKSFPINICTSSFFRKIFFQQIDLILFRNRSKVTRPSSTS